MQTTLRSSPALERACRYLRLPGSPDTEPVCVRDGPEGALRCRGTGRVFRVDGGVLDLLGADLLATDTQKMLDTRFTAWAYDRLRKRLAPAIGMPTFAREFAMVEELRSAGYDPVESGMEGRWVGYAWGATPAEESRRPTP